MKRHIRVSAIREIQLKTMRHHAAPTGVAEIKETDTSQCGQTWSTQNPSDGGNVKRCSPFGKESGSSPTC